MNNLRRFFVVVLLALASTHPLFAQWVQTNGPYSGDVQSLAVSGTNLFAGTWGGGVFLSTNNGTNWTQTGLTNTYVDALAVSGTNLFTGTWGGGVWRRPLSEMVTSVDRLSADLPTHFSLSQNYPNPFNPTTTIDFNLAVDSKVTLKLFDILGQEIVTLVNGNLSAGSHKVQFNANGLNSGVYFYRIDASGIDGKNFTAVKQMILNK